MTKLKKTCPWLCLETVAHQVDEATGADGVAVPRPLTEVGILPSPQVVLVARVVGFLIDHEAAVLNPDGVAASEEEHQVGAVIAALKMAPAEVLALVEDYLHVGNHNGSV